MLTRASQISLLSLTSPLALPLPSNSLSGTCRFGVQCVEAHSGYELKEWRERHDYRRKKLQKASKIFGKTFVDALQDKLTLPKDEPKVLRHAIEGISCVSLIPLEMTARGKNERIVWTFEIVTKKVMCRVRDI